MSKAPERICVYPLEGTWAYGGMGFAESDEPEQVEYVRANRIEELETQLREALMQSLADLGQAQDAYAAQLKAEARLAKAVELLGQWRLASAGHISVRSVIDKHDAILAELKGDS